jgi:hypothetical protein
VEFDSRRIRPYKTGELARLFGVDRNTIIRWLGDGRFGEEGTGWTWTAAGPGKGDRIVSAKSVREYIKRNT